MTEVGGEGRELLWRCGGECAARVLRGVSECAGWPAWRWEVEELSNAGGR